MQNKIVIALAFAAGLTSNAALAAELGTADDAKALLTRAIEHINKVGTAAAFKDLADPKGAFVDRDLYVFCQGMNGDMLAHGANAALIGKNLKGLKDADGKQFVVEMINVAGSTGEGWIEYKWPNPTTKKIEQKSSFIRKVNDMFCGVGIYK